MRNPVLLGVVLPVMLSAQVGQPQIFANGVVGAGLSSPPVVGISSGGLVSIFGANFGPAGLSADVGSKDLINGALPTMLGGVCVQINGIAAPLLAVRTGLVNAQVPFLGVATSATVRVLANCATPNELASNAATVPVQPVTPEFFPLAYGAGPEPVAAVDITTGSYVGPAGLIPGANVAPANPGDLVEIFATGMGPLMTPLAPGVLATGTDSVTEMPTISIGDIALDVSSVLYVGAAPGDAGVYQLNLLLPADIPEGNQPIDIDVGDIPGATGYISIGAPAGSACSAPGIDSFTIVPDEIPAPGPVTLYWSVSDSANVSISTLGNNLVSSGSFQVNAAGPVTYTLTATSSCGTTTAQASAGVGAPSISSIGNVSRAGAGTAGQPGDLVAIQLTNIGDPSEIDYVTFQQQSTGGYASANPEYTSGQTIYVRVPYVADSNLSTNYDSGVFSVTATVSDMTSAGITFDVQPLQYAGDPVGDFKTLISGMTTGAANALGQITGDPNYGQSASALLAFLDPYATDLNRIANDLASTGTTTFQIDLPSAVNPNPQTVTVGAADVMNWMAFRQNLSAAAATAAGAALSGKGIPRPADASDPLCLLRVPNLAVTFCQGVSAATGPIDDFTDQLAKLIDPDVLEIAASGAKSLELGKIAALADKVNTYALYAKAFCLVAPVYLKNFYFIPSTIDVAPPPAPSQRTELDANLVALSAPNAAAIVKYLVDTAYDKVYEKTKGSKKWGPDEVRVGLASLVELLTQRFSATIASALSILPQAPATGGSRMDGCDIQMVRSENPKIIQKQRDATVADPYYYFYGLRQGSALIAIDPIKNHFLISKSLFTGNQPACKFYPDGSPECYANLAAGGTNTNGVRVVMQTYNVGSFLNLFPGQAVSAEVDQLVDYQSPIVIPTSADGKARAGLRVRRVNNNTWRIDTNESDRGYTANSHYFFTSSGIGGSLQCVIKSARAGTAHIHMNVNAKGDCWIRYPAENGPANGSGVFQLQWQKPNFTSGDIAVSTTSPTDVIKPAYSYYVPVTTDPPSSIGATFFFSFTERFGFATNAGGPAFTQSCTTSTELKFLHN